LRSRVKGEMDSVGQGGRRREAGERGKLRCAPVRREISRGEDSRGGRSQEEWWQRKNHERREKEEEDVPRRFGRIGNKRQTYERGERCLGRTRPGWGEEGGRIWMGGGGEGGGGDKNAPGGGRMGEGERKGRGKGRGVDWGKKGEVSKTWGTGTGGEGLGVGWRETRSEGGRGFCRRCRWGRKT